MNNYQKALIEEHSQLVIRTQNLHNYIYSSESDNDNKVEFTNKAIQLIAMKKYEECLRARMENADISFENGEYFERVSSLHHMYGSDYDVDSETIKENEHNNDDE